MKTFQRYLFLATNTKLLFFKFRFLCSPVQVVRGAAAHKARGRVQADHVAQRAHGLPLHLLQQRVLHRVRRQPPHGLP